MNDEIECQNHANCGDYCETPREIEMALCADCLDSYDMRERDYSELKTLREENAKLRAAIAQPAPQDEPALFDMWWNGRGLPEAMKAPFFMVWKARAALAASPAQTEQPANFRKARCINMRPGMGEVTFYVERGVPSFMDPGCTVYVSDTAPTAQTGHDTFCVYCGGNDEEPQDHCTDCARPTTQSEQSGLVEALEKIAAGERLVERSDGYSTVSEVENDMTIDYPGIAKEALAALQEQSRKEN